MNDSMECNTNFAVTTSHRSSADQMEKALQIAIELGVPFIARNDLSLEQMQKKLKIESILVVSKLNIFCVSHCTRFFFHPGLARLRIKDIKDGKTDQMIEAMSLEEGNSVLDCTMGLGTDAIVSSFVAGGRGKVTALEGSKVISFIVGNGLLNYHELEGDIERAMRRIQVIHAYCGEYLCSLPLKSFDVIYFDPMFRAPRKCSPSINAIRPLAITNPLDPEIIGLAEKRAAKRVVIKERRGSPEFKRLGFEKIIGGRYAPVVYGIIDLTGSV